ncbi:hypothetical protein LPW26_08220 [Rhodopseudomonas sp. HC1]|uniref:hypothetical protein n=1 Tax=Rhodopseudomonas infernalis TaxID=2897386 RepID=UPI001EE9AB91|nr:hypothetical protein [Rhodopseudomonas infernalis]MCG6204617.1 hypothetical protein [Rhodopseudomonas infernalis]
MLYPDLNAPIYLGTADNAAQGEPARATQQLSFEFIVLSILGFKILVGTPFVWQSQPSLAAVSEFQLLFDDPAVGPTLTSRPGLGSVNDYFLERESDTRLAKQLTLRPTSAFIAEQPGKSALNWQRYIGPQMRVEPRIDSVERLFRGLIVEDAEALSDGGSIRRLAEFGFGAKFSHRGRDLADYHMMSLADRSARNHFSRATVEDEILSADVTFGSIDKLLTRTTALYQLANGGAHNASLFTKPDISRAMRHQVDRPVIDRWSVSPMNPYLFAAVMNGIGVRQIAWIALSDIRIAQIVSTHNPLRSFAMYYREYLANRLFDWCAKNNLPTFAEAVRILRYELLFDEQWKWLEPVSKLPDRRFDSTIAGVVGGAFGAPFGLDPLRVGSAVRTIVDSSYKIIDGLGFMDTIRLRALLRRYLSEVGLV